MIKRLSGLVIAIDGPDGVGKTTQVKLLVEYLQLKKAKIYATRHSGGTPIGQELRKISLSKLVRPPETDFYISLAMHADLAKSVAEHKRQGEIVIMDRSPLSMLAYNAYGSHLSDKKLAFEACERMFGDLGIDLLIYISAPAQVTEQRLKKRGALDYFESKNTAYHARVREGYQAGLKFLQKHKELGSKTVAIDGQESIESVHSQLIKAIEKVLA